MAKQVNGKSISQVDLIRAFQACLSVDYDSPATPAQKNLVMDKLREFTGAEDSFYVPGQTTTTDLAFYEGMRNVYAFISNQLQTEIKEAPKEVKKNVRTAK